ncbi:RNA exonuclease 1 homolog isoform X4 [Engystomops pustulosus]|uniref:RNA exonuclease 1 homolog isoform X4 n=1 Tax=Engystomops pustulosus TaxID=76066 RepID=UPI003AFAA1CE
MLKNTGYFRGLQCPFRDSCFRPHCLFKHGGRGIVTAGSEKARNGTEYDPYRPELPVTTFMEEDITSAIPEHGQHILELERVNRAIEEVKSQVEREQRKYEELFETHVPSKNSLHSDTYFSFEYDPGCSGSSTSGYNPTPLNKSVKASKYTLDGVDHNVSNRVSLEYTPAPVTQISRCRTNKYVIDNSKPCTDMEYDPMLNYSARLLNKAKPGRLPKRNRSDCQDESCSPSNKRLCIQTSKCEAKFSHSEDDSMAQSPLKFGKPVPYETKQSSTSSMFESQSLITVNEMAVHYTNIDNDLKGKSLNSSNKKLKLPTKYSGRTTNTINEQKITLSKSHIKRRNKQVELKNLDSKLEDDKLKKNERPSKQTKNKKSNLESSKTTYLKVNENKLCEEKTNKLDSNSKDLEVKNGKHKSKNSKSLSLNKPNIAVPENFNVGSSKRTLSHVELFGNETSDEEDNRKNLQIANSNYSNNSQQDVLSTPKGNLSVSRSSIVMDSPEIFMDSDSDLDPMEECLRVFNECQDIKTEDKGRMVKQLVKDGSQASVSTIIPGQKKRISHVTSTSYVNERCKADPPTTATIRPYSRPTPQEICYQRIQKAQEQAAQLLAAKKVAHKSSSAQKSSSLKRIAKIPDSFSSVSCEKTEQLVGTIKTCNGSSSGVQLRTVSGMASKTKTTTVEQRRAHAPSLQSASLKRPVLPTEFGAKVPTTVRQRYLNLFIDECLMICKSQQEAFAKALEEENMVYGRSSSRNIYLNVAVNTLKKLRSKGSEKKTVSKKVTNKKTISHESVLGGKLAAKTSFSVQRVIYQDEELTASCKICCRCGAEYLVTLSGNCVRQEECVHHWGRLRRQRVPGGWETNYSCCSGAVGSAGCQVAKQHVQDGRKDNLDGFVKTFEKLNTAEGNPGVFALDCEMCYTTKGLELTRVTVVNSQLQVVYDTFVRPNNKIVDYNTRFSGVTEEDLVNTSINIRDVQAVLLSMFSCDSILIGHSLESDLIALKLIHPTVVDTAVVFPHRLGLPYKRALRSLMADYLKRIIQDSVEGHDSSEDACSCMELMIWRIKEDAKVKR